MRTFNYTLDDKAINQIIDFSYFINKKNILIQIFCGNSKEVLQKLCEYLLDCLPQAVCIGSSTDGEIKDSEVSTRKTIISITTFENTQLHIESCSNKSSYENGKYIASKLCNEDTKLLIAFTDGDSTNGEEFLKGIEDINNEVKICGGMAGDNANFKQTFVCAQDKILTNGAVAVALNSKTLKVSTAYNFNWSPIGIEHKIEEVKNNRVYKISGLKPLEFYEKYLGEYVAKSLPATGIEFPLIVQRNGLPIARAVINKHKDGSLSFAGNLHEGDIVKLGFGNVELIMNNPIKSLFKDYDINDTQAFFIYSCMARRRYMPSMIDMEIKPFCQIAPTSGFFTYGEFYHNVDHNELLNQTLTIVALSEKEHEEKNINSNNLIENPISEHARSLQALTHLIQQSSKDYNEQSEELEVKSEYAQNLLTAQKQFLKHAVHETNTPLSVIMGNIEMFEMEHGKNKYLSNIEVAMKNLFSIYDDLAYLIKKNQVNVAKHDINIVDFIRSRIDFFSQSAKKSKLKFNFVNNNDEIILNFNEIKLQRIVDNNLTNAIKYTFANETIDVIILSKNANCDLVIRSNSKQILDHQKIFEEYYREENTKEGFGLGLNLVKRICSEENVGISLESGENYSSFTYTFKGIK